jgi:hypothetical protein
MSQTHFGHYYVCVCVCVIIIERLCDVLF